MFVNVRYGPVRYDVYSCVLSRHLVSSLKYPLAH